MVSISNYSMQASYSWPANQLVAEAPAVLRSFRLDNYTATEPDW